MPLPRWWPRSARRDPLILGAVLAAAAALRLVRLGGDSYWADEIYSVRVASKPFAQAVAWQDTMPPLYVSLLQPWVSVFGTGELAVRFPSVVLGVGGIALAYFLARRLADPATALVACTILAFLVPHVFYSREARSYALFVAATTASVLALLRLLEAPSLRRSSVWVVCASLMLYSHVFGLFFLAPQVWRLWSERRISGRAKAALAAAPLLLFGLWVPQLLVASTSVLGGFWIPRPDWSTVPSVVRQLAGPWLPGLLLVALSVTGFVDAARRPRVLGGPALREPALLASWIVLPILAPVLLSMLTQPFFDPRYALPVVVPVSIAAAFALRRIPRPTPRAIAVAALVLVFASAGVLEVSHNQRDDWRAATRHLDAHAAPSALVIFNEGLCDSQRGDDLQCVYEHYTDRADLRLVPMPWGWRPFDGSDVAGLENATRNETTVWLFLAHEGDPAHLLRDWLEARFPEQDASPFRGIVVTRYSNRTTP